MRKPLSDCRILSLSYIFLISYNQRCVLSKMSQLYKTNIIRALDIKKHLRFMEDDVILACRRIQMMLYDDLIDEDVVEEKIDSIKSSSNSQNVKAVAKLLSSVLQQFTVEKSEQKHETSLIIESLRPFIFSCVISRIKDIKFEWMTYRLIPPSGHPNNQTMLSDLVLYVDPISTINYELFFLLKLKEKVTLLMAIWKATLSSWVKKCKSP